MTLSRIGYKGPEAIVTVRSGYDSRDLAFPQQVLHLFDDAVACALISRIQRRSTARTVSTPSFRSTSWRVRRLAHRQLPRRSWSIFRRRLAPDDFREHTRREC